MPDKDVLKLQVNKEWRFFTAVSEKIETTVFSLIARGCGDRKLPYIDDGTGVPVRPKKKFHTKFWISILGAIFDVLNQCFLLMHSDAGTTNHESIPKSTQGYGSEDDYKLKYMDEIVRIVGINHCLDRGNYSLKGKYDVMDDGTGSPELPKIKIRGHKSVWFLFQAFCTRHGRQTASLRTKFVQVQIFDTIFEWDWFGLGKTKTGNP
ncbi:hypothetical protein C8R43DRAFT_1191929 [Mycena crocata]|nr:hypothetical protein C8R43DRAFT_1191929 [Mycena crocata]